MRNLLLLILFCSCNVLRTQTNTDVQKIEFNSNTRGYQKELIFTKDSIFIKINSAMDPENSRNSAMKIAAEEWENLTNALKDVDLSKLHTLAAPTNKRAVDAAFSSTVKITDKAGEQHASPDFDDYNPNEKLRKLLDVIQQIENEKTETKKLD